MCYMCWGVNYWNEHTAAPFVGPSSSGSHNREVDKKNIARLVEEEVASICGARERVPTDEGTVREEGDTKELCDKAIDKEWIDIEKLLREQRQEFIRDLNEAIEELNPWDSEINFNEDNYESGMRDALQCLGERLKSKWEM